ncbi:unnamed protein product [Orchesella dallaii]|uniref:Uncharacterized protein n=1 Tax=Orchesella dallaii TaxID=48710 RepID=A0ABP1QLS6_9HEXA
MSSYEDNPSMENFVNMINESSDLQKDMTDWLEVAYKVEFMVAQLPLKLIHEQNYEVLMDSADKLYHSVNSLITNKYEAVQIKAQDIHLKEGLMDLNWDEDNSKIAEELHYSFLALKAMWYAVKPELNADLQKCLRQYEELLNHVQQNRDHEDNTE